MTTGNNVVQTVTWNDRAQPTNLQVTSGVTNLLTLGFYPCAGQVTSCASGNNGNLQSQTITQPGLSRTQTYSYDNLNRLTAATENGSPGWTQNYQYDVNGNRWVSANTNLPALSLETPIASSWYSGTVPNRINTWTYDAAGNVMQVGGMTRTFAYDAENRQVSATINSATATYGYDGNGLRVSKTSGGNTTVYVYDAFGYLGAEYSSQASTSACATNTCYAILDHLGSTRMLTDANGSSTVTRYDYLPFGQELLASTNGRTTGMGYLASADLANPKYTGKNRDGETGMDWFEVRHMSGAQGRFQSVDPGNAGADPINPQTWNAYSYVGNNPLSYTDPSGQSWFGVLAGVLAGIFGGPEAGVAVYGAFTSFENLVQGKPPLVFGSSLPSIGAFGGCGGPLGNCGTLGSDPWSENSSLGNVQDPGRFIFGVQSDDVPIDSPWFDAVRAGVRRAEPGVNLAGVGIVVVSGIPVIVPAAIGAGSAVAATATRAAATVGTMQVAVGRGQPYGIHIAYRANYGTWLHGTRDIFGKIVVNDEGVAGFARFAWFKFRVPVLNPGAVAGTCGTSASNCLSAAYKAFLKGWGF